MEETIIENTRAEGPEANETRTEIETDEKAQDSEAPENRDEIKHVNSMGTDSIVKLIIKFSVPAIIGTVCNAFQNIVNRIFVGQAVGTLALGAVSVSFPVMIFYIALANLFGIGATTLTAIRLGQKRNKEAEQILGVATLIMFIIPIVLLVVCLLFREPILTIAGATDANMQYCKDYFTWIVVAMVFCLPCIGINNFIRTEGSPRISMWTQIMSSVINVVVNYICVIRLDWGVKGAAFGVLVGNLVALIWVLSYFRGKKSFLKIRKENLRLRWNLIKKIAILGMAPFLMQIANCVQSLIMNKTVVAYGGDAGLAIVSVITGMSGLFVLSLVGLNQGAQPIMGYNYGATIYPRVKKTLYTAMIFATALGTAFFVLLQVFGDGLCGLFMGASTDLVPMASHALKVYYLFLPLIGAQIVCTGYFQATGKPVFSALLSLSRQVLIFIPCLLILPNFFGLEGAWMSAALGDSLTCITTAVLIVISINKMNKMIEKGEVKYYK